MANYVETGSPKVIFSAVKDVLRNWGLYIDKDTGEVKSKNKQKEPLTPVIYGDAGSGKTYQIREIATDLNLELLEVKIGSMSPEDWTGLPIERNREGVHGMRSDFLPPSIFPLYGRGDRGDAGDMVYYDMPPEGKDGWLLFLN